FATDVAAAEAGHRTAAGAGNVDVAASHDRDVGLLSDHEIDVTRPGDRHGGVLALQPRSVDIAGAADRDARETRGPAGGDAASAADVEVGPLDLEQADLEFARPGYLALEAFTLDPVDADVAGAGLRDGLELRHGDVKRRTRQAAPVAPVEPALRADCQRVAFDYRLELRERLGRAFGADRRGLAVGDHHVLRTRSRDLVEFTDSVGGGARGADFAALADVDPYADGVRQDQRGPACRGSSRRYGKHDLALSQPRARRIRGPHESHLPHPGARLHPAQPLQGRMPGQAVLRALIGGLPGTLAGHCARAHRVHAAAGRAAHDHIARAHQVRGDLAVAGKDGVARSGDVDRGVVDEEPLGVAAAAPGDRQVELVGAPVDRGAAAAGEAHLDAPAFDRCHFEPARAGDRDLAVS